MAITLLWETVIVQNTLDVKKLSRCRIVVMSRELFMALFVFNIGWAKARSFIKTVKAL